MLLDEQRVIRIRTFLKEFKKIASQSRGIYLIPREESLKTLADLGLTKKNFRELIMTLSVTDYCEGPKGDIDRSGEVWVFGKQVGGKEIYIKLKLASIGEKKIAECMSFHPAVFPLCYPFPPNERKKES
jgi:hypothetical protein